MEPRDERVPAEVPGATVKGDAVKGTRELAGLIDPRDPRAPAAEVWERLSPEERAWVADRLPSEEEPFLAPEGDLHAGVVGAACTSLRAFWQRTGRKAYVGSDMNVFYPGERRFAPDCFVVLDVEPHPREHWLVSAEGKGLDFVLEVAFRGDHRKDAERNVEWFARLGIPEYFVFDAQKRRLTGHRLPQGGGSYAPVVPQHGRYRADALGLEVGVEGGRVRFYHGTAPLLDADELRAELERRVDDVIARAEQEAARAEQEAARADQEAARALAAARARVRDVCELLEVEIDEERAREIETLDADSAGALAESIKRARGWPGR